jgi:hypothetical protein
MSDTVVVNFPAPGFSRSHPEPRATKIQAGANGAHLVQSVLVVKASIGAHLLLNLVAENDRAVPGLLSDPVAVGVELE